MSILALYLVLVVMPAVDAVASFAGVFAGVFVGLGTIVGLVVFTVEDMWDEDWMPKLKRYHRNALIGIFGLLAVGILTPDEGELKQIIGGYVVTNIEGVEKLPENLVDYANRFLEGEK